MQFAADAETTASSIRWRSTLHHCAGCSPATPWPCLHAAQQDLDVLTHACGAVPSHMYDTQLASGFPRLQHAVARLAADGGAEGVGGQGRPADRLVAPPVDHRADWSTPRPTSTTCWPCRISSTSSSPSSGAPNGSPRRARSCVNARRRAPTPSQAWLRIKDVRMLKPRAHGCRQGDLRMAGAAGDGRRCPGAPDPPRPGRARNRPAAAEDHPRPGPGPRGRGTAQQRQPRQGDPRCVADGQRSDIDLPVARRRGSRSQPAAGGRTRVGVDGRSGPQAARRHRLARHAAPTSSPCCAAIATPGCCRAGAPSWSVTECPAAGAGRAGLTFDGRGGLASDRRGAGGRAARRPGR